MNDFDDNFKTRLWDTIATIEADSGIEIVVIIKPCSEDYTDIALLGSGIVMLLALTFFFFAPPVFGDYLVFTATLAAYLLSFFIIAYIPGVKRILTPKSRRRRSVEIMARALFQKGQLHQTRAGVGTLIYCSLLEQEVFILPDRGAADAVPPEIWTQLQQDFARMFAARKPAEGLLSALQASGTVFARYLPTDEDDINEIPDDLEVAL